MNHEPIVDATRVLADDHALGCRTQLDRLDALVGELQELSPGDPSARGKLYEARCLAQSLFTECRTHPGPGPVRVDRWFLSVLGVLNGCAERHGLEQTHKPFEL